MATESATLHLTTESPTRVDLAGGTYDIWPLYLFLKNPITINLGINLFSRATLKSKHLPRGGNQAGRVTLRSLDQKHERSLTFSELEKFEPEPALSLHILLLRHFVGSLPKTVLESVEFELETSALSPAGAGLGGSSSLAVTIAVSLKHWSNWIQTGKATFDWRDDRETLLDVVRDVETRVIKVPAGLQDYYGAMFGGIQKLSWQAGKREHAHYSEELLREIESRLILFYSGHSRNSGINNWVLYKCMIDREGPVESQFESLSKATFKLDQALRTGDWKLAGEAISEEWSTRHQLAPGISTPEIDQAIALGKTGGASAAKICGAGGGGCFFLYMEKPSTETRQKIVHSIREKCSGIRELSFKAVPHGVRVKVES